MPLNDPEKRKEYTDKYYQDHKEEIRGKDKLRRQTEEYKERRKQYYEATKEQRKEHNNEQINCGCGGCYKKKYKHQHEKTKSHIYFLKTGERSPWMF